MNFRTGYKEKSETNFTSFKFSIPYSLECKHPYKKLEKNFAALENFR